MQESSETSAAPKPNPDLARVYEELVRLSTRVSAFDVRSLENTDESSQARALATCKALAEDTLQLLAELVVLLPDDEALPDDEVLPDDEASNGEVSIGEASEQLAREPASELEQLQQVTYLARMEIQRVLLRWLSGGTVAPEFLVHQGCSLYRKVWRGVCVVEEALARARGTSSTLEQMGSRAAALRVRRIYAWFRRSINTDIRARKDNIQRLLRTVGTRIATLVGKDEYAELRPDDRVLFVRLQKRILAWLSSERPTFEEGRRIWEDCRAMADILRQVNLRAELIAHDAALARALNDELATLDEGERVSGELLERLLSLEGLDDELDKYLAKREAPPRMTVERVLGRADAAARSRGM